MNSKNKKTIDKDQVNILKELIGTITDELVDIIHDDVSIKIKLTERILIGAGFREKVAKNLVAHLKSKRL
ncbi:MAG: hypothetical protein ABIG60_05905 [Patescibacteria group bacterium]